MFCPRCGAQNTEEAKFCRACGTDISLVPQAVTGVLAERLAAKDESFHGRRRQRREREREDRPATIERAVKSFFLGVAFLFVSFAVFSWAPAGRIWWFWMLIPAFSMLATGVATYLRLAEEKKRPAAPPFYTPPQTAVPPVPRVGELPPRNTGEMISPPSVTEGTTRHLGVPVERARGDE
jgi:hypothetical protein